MVVIFHGDLWALMSKLDVHYLSQPTKSQGFPPFFLFFFPHIWSEQESEYFSRKLEEYVDLCGFSHGALWVLISELDVHYTSEANFGFAK